MEISRVARRRHRYAAGLLYHSQVHDGKSTQITHNKLLTACCWFRQPLQKLSLRLQVGDYRDYGENPGLPHHPNAILRLIRTLYRVATAKYILGAGSAGLRGKRCIYGWQVEEYDVVITCHRLQDRLPRSFEENFINF